MGISPNEEDRLLTFIDENHDGVIQLSEFVDAFAAVDQSDRTSWQTNVAHQMHAELFKHRRQLHQVCTVFDNENNGRIPSPKFESAMESFNEVLNQPFSHSQIASLTAVLTN